MVSIHNSQALYEKVAAMSPEELAAQGIIKSSLNDSYRKTNDTNTVSIFPDNVKRIGTLTESNIAAINERSTSQGGEEIAANPGDKFKMSRNADTGEGFIHTSAPEDVQRSIRGNFSTNPRVQLIDENGLLC